MTAPRRDLDSRVREAGFSLIELIAAMTVVIIIIGFVSMLISGIQKEFNRQQPRMEAYNNAEMTMDTMVRVIRVSGAKSPGCSSSFTVNALKPGAPVSSGVYTTLEVEADWNPSDCKLTGIDEKVKFSVKNGEFFIDDKQKEPFAEYIRAIRFKFYDEMNALMSDPVTNAAKINYVQIEVETNDDTRKILKSGVSVRSR